MTYGPSGAVTLRPPPREATVSIRLIWPFARLLGSHPGALDFVNALGITIADFPNPDTRVSHRVAMQLLEHAVERTRDPTIGLRAGELVDPGAGLAFSRRNCTSYAPPVEVRLSHPRPSYADQYDKYFGTRVVFGAPFNAMVLHKSHLAAPMRRASPDVLAAFEHQAKQLLGKLEDCQSVTGRAATTSRRSSGWARSACTPPRGVSR